MSVVKIKEFCRVGYKGAEVTDQDGVKFIQVSRSPRRGVIVSTGKGKVGFSLVSPAEDLSEFRNAGFTLKTVEKTSKGGVKYKAQVREGEKRDPWEYGEEIAIRRAQGAEPNPPIPGWFKPQYDHFLDRMRRYYIND